MAYESWTPSAVAHACRVVGEHADVETGLLLLAAADKLDYLVAGISAHQRATGYGVPGNDQLGADLRLWALMDGDR